MKSNKKAKTKGGWKRPALIALIVVLALVLALLLAVVFGMDYILGMLNRPDDSGTMPSDYLASILNETDETDPNFTGPVLSEDDIAMQQAAEIFLQDNENIVNILLLGTDTSSTQYRSRSDSMILCTINRTTKTLTMTSFMRDTYLYIPGFYKQRMNVAYAVGGFEAIYDTLEYNFGVSVNKGVAVNFESFKEVIETVGGVDITLTAKEANHLNGKYYWSLTEGLNHLNGEQALAYARIRKIDSDYARTDRQRAVLTALVEKAKTLSVSELSSLVTTMIPMVTTDMSNDEILSAVIVLAPLLKDLKIETQRIPINEGHSMAMVDGMSVLLPNLEMNRQYLIDTLGIEETENP